MNHSAEREQPDKGIIREQAYGPTHGRLEEPELLLDDASVNHKEEYRRGQRRGRRVVEGRGSVLDRGALGIEFTGHVVLADSGVVRGKMVACEAERADPDLGREVDDSEGVEHGEARRFAAERVVREDEKRGGGTDRGDGGRDGDDALARFHLCAGPIVPGHADTVRTVRIGSGGDRAGEFLRHG